MATAARWPRRVFSEAIERHQAAVFRFQPPAPVRRRKIADIGDRRPAGARRWRHAPAHQNELALGADVAHDWRGIIRKLLSDWADTPPGYFEPPSVRRRSRRKHRCDRPDRFASPRAVVGPWCAPLISRDTDGRRQAISTDAREIHCHRADPSEGDARDPDARARRLDAHAGGLPHVLSRLSTVKVRRRVAWIGKVDQLAYCATCVCHTETSSYR
jgi:hypothetical protein